MTTHAGTMGAAAIAAALLATTPIHAQEPLSEEAVTNFFDEMEQDVAAMAESEDFDGLLEWADAVIADEAYFYASIESYAGDDRKTFSVLSLSKQEVMEMGRAALGILAGAGQQQVLEDYAVSFQLEEFTPAGPGAATVLVQITENVTFALPQREAAGTDDGAEPQNGQEAGDGATISLDVTADCHMLVRRDDAGDGLLMGLSACDVTTRH